MATRKIKHRFDGYLPVVVDVETTGVEMHRNGILEIALSLVDYNDEGRLVVTGEDFWHVEPFEGAIIDAKAMAVNKIDQHHPFRFAKPECEVLTDFFAMIARAVAATRCRRAVLVGHNAHFDLNCIMTAAKRCKMKDLPLHAFTCLDTATIGGIFYGKTVLAKALKQAGIEFSKDEAHSAVYDTQKTAELFCKVINSLHAQTDS